MDRIGPITTKYATERTENPSVDELKATVRWAVSVENCAAASLFFLDRETDDVSDCYQLLGPHHHLASLTDQRIVRARKLLTKYGAAEPQLEPRRYEGYPSIDVEFTDLRARDHVSMALEILEDVYNTNPAALARIQRSTHELDRAAETEKVAICQECSTQARVRYMLNAYGDVYYQAIETGAGRNDSDEYDFIFSQNGYWICANCFSNSE